MTPEEITAARSKTGRSNVRRSKSHERLVAKLLSLWTGQEFRRRRVEGRDVSVLERESTSDVIPVRGEVYCAIEAKCGEIQTFDALMANPVGTKFTEWWHQVNYDCSLIERLFGRPFYPMLFFRPQPTQNWVAISAKLFSQLILKPKAGTDKRVPGLSMVWFPHLYFDAYFHLGKISCNVVRTKKRANMKFVPLCLDPVIFCRWHDFAANVDPMSFFRSSQSYKQEVSDGVLRSDPGS